MTKNNLLGSAITIKTFIKDIKFLKGLKKQVYRYIKGILYILKKSENKTIEF